VLLFRTDIFNCNAILVSKMVIFYLYGSFPWIYIFKFNGSSIHCWCLRCRSCIRFWFQSLRVELHHVKIYHSTNFWTRKI
jgi:hypothetical protein